MKDWQFRVCRQVHIPPFKPYCATAEKVIGGVRHLINEEGDTAADALIRVKCRVAVVASVGGKWNRDER